LPFSKKEKNLHKIGMRQALTYLDKNGIITTETWFGGKTEMNHLKGAVA